MELSPSQWCPLKLQAQSCSFVVLLRDLLPPPTPCIFCLPLADYFAARHRAVLL